MEIKKTIRLNNDEIEEALLEYLSKRNIAYEMDEIYIELDDKGNVLFADVISR